MDMNEYQKEAKKYDISYDKVSSITNDNLIKKILQLAHSISGLAEEIGEVQGKFKKYLRGDLTLEQFNNATKKELGDVLWYLSDLAGNLYMTLDNVAWDNLEKLRSRKERGKIKGDGDNR